MFAQFRTVSFLKTPGLALKIGLSLLVLFFVSACVSAKIPPSANQILVATFEQGGLIAKETPRGVVVYLPSVMFMFGSANLTSEAADKVKFIARVSNDRLAVNRNISVEGHTDSVGSEADNMMLSEVRANSVSSMLTGNGVDAGRIETDWFGESRPLVPNTLTDGSDSPEGRAANRRVEFILLNP